MPLQGAQQDTSPKRPRWAETTGGGQEELSDTCPSSTSPREPLSQENASCHRAEVERRLKLVMENTIIPKVGDK